VRKVGEYHKSLRWLIWQCFLTNSVFTTVRKYYRMGNLTVLVKEMIMETRMKCTESHEVNGAAGNRLSPWLLFLKQPQKY
jgi:hypothetical protein